MADRTTLDSNFISLVLSVSGRVRPMDLHAIPEAERANALQHFYQQHAAAMPLHFDGDTLVAGPGAGAAAAPAPLETAPETAPAPIAAPEAVAVGAVEDAAPTPAEPFVSDYGPALESAITDSDFFSIEPNTTAGVPTENGSDDAPVRGRNLKSAKAMLITGIVLTVVFALAGVAAAVGLGLFAVPGL